MESKTHTMSYTSLSKSKIWEIMGDYYNQVGLDAWLDDIVPSDITSNKYIASIYAELILSKLIDWKESSTQNASEDFYIFEIGTGLGKFSFYILKILQKFTQDSDRDLFSRIKYIMTDISIKNVEGWQKHPSLQEFVEQGVLDFAYFNATTDDKIDLILSKKTIKKNSLKTPIIAICNYLFDTLPHDSFKIKNHKLYENLIKIETPKAKKNSSKFFDNLKYKFKLEEAGDNYYDCHHLNKILLDYKQHFTKGSILVPTGGLTCIRNMEQFTSEHLLMIIADKGYSDLEEVEDLDNPDISLHGSVSLMVNFDAIERYFDSKKGISLLMPNKWADFQIGCFINKDIKAPKLTQAFYKNLTDFSPQDLFDLCYTDDDELNPGINSINTILSLLQLSKWDPGIFSSYVYSLIDLLTESDELLLQHEKIITNGVEKVWRYFYDFHSESDICFMIALLLYEINHNKDAIKYFELSLKYFPESPETYYNLALALQEEGDLNKAKKAIEKALKLKPSYKEAKSLLKEL